MSTSLNRTLFTYTTHHKKRKHIIDNQEQEPEEEGQDLDMTQENAREPLAIQEERVCKQCRDSLKQITQVEQIKIKVNNQMILNTQVALTKANEFLSHYSQYLPDDYFNDDSDDSMGLDAEQDLKQIASASYSAVSGFLSKITNSFKDSQSTKNTKAKPTKQEEESDDEDSSTGKSDQLSFKSAEKVFEYVSDVTESVAASYKSRLATLFSDMQQSYAQLFFYAHYQLELNQRLLPAYQHYLEFQDFHIRANNKLKSDLQAASQKLQYETYLNKEAQEKIRELSQRVMRMQSETMDHKIARQSLEKQNRHIESELEEVKNRCTALLGRNIETERELEIVRRERNFMTETFKELQIMLQNKANAA